MLRFAMLSLVCSMSTGVFGFGGGGTSSWIWGQILFLVFLISSAIGFLAGLMVRPQDMREARIDDHSTYEWRAKDIRGT